MTSIRVNEETRKKLIELKQQGNFKNADELITQLIKVYEMWNKSEVVRVVRE